MKSCHREHTRGRTPLQQASVGPKHAAAAGLRRPLDCLHGNSFTGSQVHRFSCEAPARPGKASLGAACKASTSEACCHASKTEGDAPDCAAREVRQGEGQGQGQGQRQGQGRAYLAFRMEPSLRRSSRVCSPGRAKRPQGPSQSAQSASLPLAMSPGMVWVSWLSVAAVAGGAEAAPALSLHAPRRRRKGTMEDWLGRSSEGTLEHVRAAPNPVPLPTDGTRNGACY